MLVESVVYFLHLDLKLYGFIKRIKNWLAVNYNILTQPENGRL